MSTRSMIGLKPNANDPTIIAVYCHSDGYFEHNGLILFTHYQDPVKVAALIALGDLSVLGPEIGEKMDFDNADMRRTQTLAYHRDRGDPLQTTAYQNAEEFLNETRDGMIEFRYLFKGGEWLTSAYGFDSSIDGPAHLLAGHLYARRLITLNDLQTASLTAKRLRREASARQVG